MGRSVICDTCYERPYQRSGDWKSDGTFHHFECMKCHTNGSKCYDLKYVDFTNPNVVKLQKHPINHSLYTEAGFCEYPFTPIPHGAMRVVGEEYIEHLPQFVPFYPFTTSKLPKKILVKFIEEAKAKMEHYQDHHWEGGRWQYKNDDAYAQIAKIIFEVDDIDWKSWHTINTAKKLNIL